MQKNQGNVLKNKEPFKKMRFAFVGNKKSIYIALVFTTLLISQGCIMEWRTPIQWNSQKQILMSEKSQVKIRSIQSRVFDTTDKIKILRGIVDTLQDLCFEIDMLDEDLGVVSGKKMFNADDSWPENWTYYSYETDNLLMLNTNFRTWGPFHYREDLTRLTVTLRPKEESRSLVRASLQYNNQAVEDPEIYQKFFKLLRNSIFLSAKN
jgi:hypothetical protein